MNEKSPNETQELTREAANRFKRSRIKELLIPELEKLLDIFPDEIEANERTLAVASHLEVEVVRTTLPTEYEIRISRTIDQSLVGRIQISLGNLIALARRSVL
jgi:hypothetical protein